MKSDNFQEVPIFRTYAILIVKMQEFVGVKKRNSFGEVCGGGIRSIPISSAVSWAVVLDLIKNSRAVLADHKTVVSTGLYYCWS